MAEHYKLGDIDNERFFQIPKSLILNPEYHGISNTSKIIYAILKDRMCLSREEGWHDENGDIYLLFDQQKLANEIGTSRKTINRAMKELKDTSLIDVVRQGVNKPNKIYINRPKPFIGLHQDGTKMSHQDGTKMSQWMGQKCPTNDTENNETEVMNKEYKESPTPYSEIVMIYSDTCPKLQRVLKLTDKRKKKVKAFWEFLDKDIEKVKDFFKQAASSQFINGENDRNWKADFEWLVNINNSVKVLEGKYASREESIPSQFDLPPIQRSSEQDIQELLRANEAMLAQRNRG